MNPEELESPELIALLASEAELEMKARACQQLAIVGGPEAVPALAALLSDNVLSNYARYPLESIEAPEAGAALREALPRLEGRSLAGVIDSLGRRRDEAAVPALRKLASDAQGGVSAEALSALGKIASEDALKGIEQALKKGPPEPLIPAAHATLTAATRLNREGKSKLAAPALRLVAASSLPDHLRAAARAEMEPKAASNEGTRIFDGKTFSGWEGDFDWFRISKGAIVAGTLNRPIPRNEFLRYEQELADFELRLKARVVGAEANGGIQLRSHRVPGSHEMEGYQADIAAEYWGGLYDESRRRVFLGTRADPDTIAKVIKPAGWNDYIIRCEGPRVRLWLNGLLTTDFTEGDAALPRSGYIALQIHSGPPSEVWYKDIRLTELKR